MIEVVEPATAEVMAELPQAGVDETDAAVARAKRAFPGWRAVAPGGRADLLRRLADALEESSDELARTEARNAGKPIADARSEMEMVVETFRFYAGGPERLLGDTIPVPGGVNDTIYGLSGSIWTRDGAKALRVSRAIETGVLSVNSNTSVRVSTPFGGFKQSGLGRELGPHALEHYTELKNVYYATE
jgi:acyl-CoA reductase-like NAD-dependent aldehyde dehydrogenase